jgi:hypothetical protein
MIIGCPNQQKQDRVETKSKSDFEKYDELVWSGRLNFKDKEYQQSLSNFQDAFEILPNENVSDYFYASTSALYLKNDELAKDLIIKSIQKANASESYFDSFKDFNPFREKEFFTAIKSDYAKYQSDFFNGIEKPEIFKEVEFLKKRDQNVRKDGSSSEEMQRIDSLNIKRLIEINKEYGWQENQWLLLWHHRGIHYEDNYVWNYFRPLINKKIKDGELRKGYWARYEDEKSMFSEKGVQIYGMYWHNYDQFPIDNIDKVDSLRNTVGLPPLAYLEKVYGIVLPKDYVEKLPLTSYKNNRAVRD